MIPLRAPRSLRTDGQLRPLGVGDAPLLSWAPQFGQRALQVLIEDDDGATVWDSGRVDSSTPEERAVFPLRSRTGYRWRVRVADAAGVWSPWSTAAEWETPLLHASDWSASWIARPVAPAERIIRSIARDRVDWAEAGDTLDQEFVASGPISAVSFDLTGERDVDVDFDLQLVDARTGATRTRTVRGPQHIWDRFLFFLELDPAAPAGRYRARLTVRQGRVGWRAGDESNPAPDDSISPLPVLGPASTAGITVRGTRAVGVDTPPAENPLFRHRFTLGTTVTAARLHVVALGTGVILVNGCRVGDAVLDPAPTDVERTVHYRTWDVGDLLRPGENEILVRAGRGTYAARGASVWGWHLAPWHTEPRMIAQLEWTDAAGTRRSVASGSDWQTAASGTTELLYVGESSASAPTEQIWEHAAVVDASLEVLRPAPLPPIREIRTLAPQLATRPEPGVEVLDFGTVIAGRLRIRVTGSAGASFRIRSGEELDPAGRVLIHNTLIAGPAQHDEYRFGRGETIDWTQEFGYRGFRWIEIETHGEVRIDEVTAVEVHTDVESVGEFDTDEPVLRWWDGALRQSFLNNLHGIPTDTPIFEKNGWTADAHLATDAVLHQLDLRATFGKWMDDHADAQGSDGIVPQIVPSPDWGREADPAWSGSTVLIPWSLYREYGELRILERADRAVRRYADGLLDISAGALWPLRSWGDWVAPGYGIPPEGGTPAATAMMASVLQHAARIVGALGDEREARRYDAEADRLARVYHEAYFDASTASYGLAGLGYRQAMNVLPLAFGLVPAEHVDGVRQSLIRDIEDRTNGHLDVGSLGARHLLPVLADAGRDDLAITVATRRTRPGWGAWYDEGQTTLMEQWSDARSHNHYFLGAAMQWIHQRIGAAALLEPGWRRFAVDPVRDPRVLRGRLRHRSVRGLVEVVWRQSSSELELEVVVPNGAEAVVAAADRVLGEGEHRLRIDRPLRTSSDGASADQAECVR